MRAIPRRFATLALFVCWSLALRPRVAGTTGIHDAAPYAVPGEHIPSAGAARTPTLDVSLVAVLRDQGFTGRVESTLEQRLGRRIDRELADLGRLLWFDTILGINNDNTCAGCHSPTNGFGDTQSIAIGIENNGIVGPHRAGPRNQRRTPLAINAAFYPNLMWNSRFASRSGDPFDNASGFLFPPPEGLLLSSQPHLLAAQAFIPPTERNEAAGFAFPGDNFAIRAEVLRRVNGAPEYRMRFGRSFPAVRAGGPITFDMLAAAIAEFEFTLVFTDTPLDRFARGERGAMTTGQKAGALLFFGKAGCVSCHAVSGRSNEMFSDFAPHVIGVPQIVPAVTNSVFDGPGTNEDFGLEQVSRDPADRYRFRTAPLRNLAVMPAFMHNGCFTTIEETVRHHLGALSSARGYTPARLAPDLRAPLGPIEPVLARLDPLLVTPATLTSAEFRDLVEFLRDGLLDSRARPERLRRFVPEHVPSGRAVLSFEFPGPAPAGGAPGGGAATAGDRRPLAAPDSPGASTALRVRLLAPGIARGTVSFAIDVPSPAEVSAFVHDVMGRRIRTLAEARSLRAGAASLSWDGRNDAGEPVAAGIYFVRARSGSGEGMQRFVYLGR